MTSKGKSSHVGSALSIADILAVLYSNINVNPKNPLDPKRDRFILSKGHACLAYYSALSEIGYIKKEELHCSDTKFGITKNEEIEKLKKQIELEKAKKPGYWELFAAFYYKDDNAPLYCRKYARPDSWFKRPGTACLKPNGEWKILK